MRKTKTSGLNIKVYFVFVYLHLAWRRKKISLFSYLRFPMTIAIFLSFSFSDKSILNKPFYKCNFHVFHDKLSCLFNDTLLLDVKNV